jgi:UrcA family protein
MGTLILRPLACASCLLLANGLNSTIARAEPPLVNRSVTVDISDLNLAQPHDVSTLRHRIDKAARTACAPETTPREDPPGFRGYKACYNQAVQDAMAQANRVLLASKESPERR